MRTRLLVALIIPLFLILAYNYGSYYGCREGSGPCHFWQGPLAFTTSILLTVLAVELLRRAITRLRSK